MIGEDKKILIVEDEQSLLKALEEKFNHEGFEVLKAEDGEEGLKMALQNHPDIILADIFMPKLNGISMIKKLREDEWGKTAKVIMLTNLDAQDEVIHDLSQTQPAYYLTKADTKMQEIVDKVNEVVG